MTVGLASHSTKVTQGSGEGTYLEENYIMTI